KRTQTLNYYKNCNKTPHRSGTDVSDRRTYYAPYREYVKKQTCPCTGCKHALTEDHTNACRAVNNNNTLTHQSLCTCSADTAEKIKAAKNKEARKDRQSPRVALVVLVALMAFPFVPASNAFFYVGFVVAERVLYAPSAGFCLLVGLGAGALTRGWRLRETRARLFACSLLLLLAAMCGRTLRRNLDWRNEETLFRSALHINPPKGR
ncbi:Transmembrane and TPR repeat-containing protein CG4341, partial [Eumeta japonica]